MGAYFRTLLGIWVLAATSFFSVYCLASFYTSDTVTSVSSVAVERDDPLPYRSTYSRFKEIKKECSSVLAEASELHPEQNRLYMIEQDLSFVNGDWKQHKGSAPLLPFTKGESNHTIPFRRRVSNYRRSFMRRNSNYIVPGNYSPINLASFWITDVDLNKVSGKMVNVSGILQLAISTSRGIRRRRGHKTLGFILVSLLLRFIWKESTRKNRKIQKRNGCCVCWAVPIYLPVRRML